MSRRTHPCGFCSGRTRHANRICARCRRWIRIATAQNLEPRMPTRSTVADWHRFKGLAVVREALEAWRAAQDAEIDFLNEIAEARYRSARRAMRMFDTGRWRAR